MSRREERRERRWERRDYRRQWRGRRRPFWAIFGMLIALYYISLSSGLFQGQLHWPMVIAMVAVVAVMARTLKRRYYTEPHTGSQREEKLSKDQKMRKILQLARQRQGRISALEAAMDANLEIEESKVLLEQLVDKGMAIMDVNDHAAIIYNFPDFISEAALSEAALPEPEPAKKRKDLLP